MQQPGWSVCLDKESFALSVRRAHLRLCVVRMWLVLIICSTSFILECLHYHLPLPECQHPTTACPLFAAELFWCCTHIVVPPCPTPEHL